MCVFWSGWNILKMREVITTGTKNINNNKANNEGVLARETSHTADITLQFVKELIWKQHELNDIINLSSQNTHSFLILNWACSARDCRLDSLSPAAAACCYGVIWSRVWGVGMGTLGSVRWESTLKAQRAWIVVSSEWAYISIANTLSNTFFNSLCCCSHVQNCKSRRQH